MAQVYTCIVEDAKITEFGQLIETMLEDLDLGAVVVVLASVHSGTLFNQTFGGND